MPCTSLIDHVVSARDQRAYKTNGLIQHFAKKIETRKGRANAALVKEYKCRSSTMVVEEVRVSTVRGKLGDYGEEEEIESVKCSVDFSS